MFTRMDDPGHTSCDSAYYCVGSQAQCGGHMDEQLTAVERQYQEIMELARQQAQGQQVLPIMPAQTSYFFPWEYSPYRANGTTSAESQ